MSSVPPPETTTTNYQGPGRTKPTRTTPFPSFKPTGTATDALSTFISQKNPFQAGPGGQAANTGAPSTGNSGGGGGGGGGLSTGGKIGLGVGLSVGILVIAGLVLFWFMKKRRSARESGGMGGGGGYGGAAAPPHLQTDQTGPMQEAKLPYVGGGAAPGPAPVPGQAAQGQYGQGAGEVGGGHDAWTNNPQPDVAPGGREMGYGRM